MSDGRNDAEWVRESVIKEARESGDVCVSGAWCAIPRDDPSSDTVDVFRFSETV